MVSQSRCKGCGEIIGWIQTKAGRPMPCDPELLVEHLYLREPRHTGEEAITLVLENGTTIRGIRATATEPNTTQVEGYLSHFSSCPQSDSFRKPR